MITSPVRTLEMSLSRVLERQQGRHSDDFGDHEQKAFLHLALHRACGMNIWAWT